MAVLSKNIGAIYELVYNPNYVPRRSSDAHIEQLAIEGSPTFVLMKESDHEYFQVDDVTNTIWQLMDGNRTVKEVVEEAKKKDGTLTDKDVKDTIITLAEEGTIESTELEVEEKRVEVESAFQVNVHLLKNSSESLAGLFRVTRKLIKRWEYYALIAFSILGAVLFAGTYLHILANPSALSLAGSTLLGYFVYENIILTPVYAIHELSHGAVCDYYGAKPHEIGTGLYYLAPFFYCDTSDGWRLPRRARIMISAAGTLAQGAISSAFVFASLLVPPGFARTVLQAGAFLGFYGTLLNLSPILETDGYYILADVLNIPNLRDETFSFLKKGFLRAVGRPVSRARQSARDRRIFSLYGVVTVGWLAFFIYSTVQLFSIYGANACSAVDYLGLAALGSQPFSAASFAISVTTIVYFALLMTGFAVMGVVAYQKVHIGKARLETIHDKRASVFMPVPSYVSKAQAAWLVKKAKSLSKGFSRSSSVTLEPPFCVAALKLGKADESLDTTRSSMSKVELSFRSIHAKFLSKTAPLRTSAGAAVAADMAEFADQLSGTERERAVSGTKDFLKRRGLGIRTLLMAGFGTVWTLELSPDDFRRIRKQIFPSLVAEDLGGADLSPELESFKKNVVFGSDALAKLSSEIEKETSEVYRNPEVYQTAAFVEPITSKLVFAGRTDKVEGSVVWLGGLFLYQAWIGYINEALDAATFGLRSVRLLPSPVTKTQASKISKAELDVLKSDFERVKSLKASVEDAKAKISATYGSAANFHETLGSLVEDEGFDIGLYSPILHANESRLKGVLEALDSFGKEFSKAMDRFEKATQIVDEELLSRREAGGSPRKGLSDTVQGAISRIGGQRRAKSTAFTGEVKMLYAINRSLHDVIAASDIAL